MLTEEDSLILDPKGPRGLVEAVAFEQHSAVDDIVVSYQDSPQMAIQAKRSLTFSNKANSEFVKVIRQFVKEHTSVSTESNLLILAVSSRASANIKDVLRRMLDRNREVVPGADFSASKVEQNTWEGLKKIVTAEISSINNEATDTIVETLIRKMYVLCLNPEDGETDVRMVLALLRSRMNIDPLLVWRALVAICLDACKRRGTVTRSRLNMEFQKFNIVPNATPKHSNDAFFSVVFSETVIGSYGRDVVIVKKPYGSDSPPIAILELYRFDEAGNRRYRFDRTHIHHGGETISSLVIARASTWAGINRLLSNLPEIDAAQRVALMPMIGGEEQDNSPFAEAHQALCQKQLESRINPASCMHCGESISDTAAEIVEVDNYGDDFDIGPIHSRCRRSVDRVVGHVQIPCFEDYPHLVNFDIEGFAHAIRRGQTMISSSKKVGNEAIIAWNPSFQESLEAPFCVEIQLHGNQLRYITERGTLRRYTQAESVQKADWMTEQFANAKQTRNPFCYTSVTGIFGNYSALETTREPTENCVECLKATSVRYTAQIGEQFKSARSCYAPLLGLRGVSNGEWMEIDGIVPLISDPFSIEQSVRNWNAGGKNVPPFVCSLLSTDSEVDQFFEINLGTEKRIVIDPLFDQIGNQISGIGVMSMPDILQLGVDNDE